MSNVDDQLRRAAEGKDSPFAAAVQKREQQRPLKQQRPAAQAAPAAAPAPEPVDPIVAAQALLARSSEIDASFSDFRKQRDAALRREQECLSSYRALLRRNRNRINDGRWCATKQGKEVMVALSALQTEVDRLSQITTDDVDHALLWQIRIAAEFQADFTACVLAAAQPIASAHGTVKPILVEISRQQKRAMQETPDGERKPDAVEEKFFFRAEGKIFFPNGYKLRPEVQRVIRELQQLQYRVEENYERERAQAEALLREFAPDRADASGAPLDIVKLLSVAEPSPYGDACVDVALYFGGFKFVPPGEMQQRSHRGVVHLSVQNTTDSVTGKPAKLVTLHAVVGNIERTLPVIGTPPWSIELGQYGHGELGLHKGFNGSDDKPILAHLQHIQQILWLAKDRGLTVSQAIGLAEFQQYEAWRQRKYGKKPRRKGGKRKPAGQQAQGAAAPAAEPPAEAPAGGSASSGAATPTGEQPKGRRNRDRKPKAGGDNGVLEQDAIGASLPDGSPHPLAGEPRH